MKDNHSIKEADKELHSDRVNDLHKVAPYLTDYNVNNNALTTDSE